MRGDSRFGRTQGDRDPRVHGRKRVRRRMDFWITDQLVALKSESSRPRCTARAAPAHGSPGARLSCVLGVTAQPCSNASGKWSEREGAAEN